MVYSWRKDPDNTIRIDKNGMLTIVVEELIDSARQKPKRIYPVDVHKDFGTPEQIWEEAQRLLKIKYPNIIKDRADQSQAQINITDEMVSGLENYLTKEEV